ncbi:MAG: RelA/SpoT family protein [Sphaerochaetaceae bacterium]|nr:RelA/SpoT family protein [Sphaerochaetaceae bacterium]MDC7237338.1 RelA/SpoT family protein [Sphaerochaetaceae bacterium]MDC7249097.1 RelA/SpoT family protein [Sphaerochaetaceae bacterium]
MSDRIIQRFLLKIKKYPQVQQDKIIDAVNFSKAKHEGQKRKSGEPYIIHPLAVADILVQLDMDGDTICAGLLHDTLEDTTAKYDELKDRFGLEVADLVDGVTKIEVLKTDNKSVQEAETIRKMFFAMSKDARVIIIKLADKLHNMRTVKFLKPERAKEFATETLDIYAPLADRLGISWVKEELEDLSLETINKETFDYVQGYLLSKKGEQAAYLKRIEKTIYQACAQDGLGNIIVTSRAKHAYSVYLKMKKRKKDIEEIFDLLGVRILCDTITECYTLLGIVHKIWPPIEGRFKDYIAMPKANNYQSLHTTVMALDGKLLEIQIRTKAMHQTAEYGIAAHWKYKVNSGSQDNVSMDDAQFNKILNTLEKWSNEIDQNESFMEDIKEELLKNTICVFTPQGHIVELPKNSTALDFAYRIHTEVGNHTAGAKADGSIIALNQPLKHTQVIEILTNPSAHPHLSWLRLAQTQSARKKIRTWLNRNDNIIIDKNIIATPKSVAPVTTEPTTTPKEEEIGEIIRNVSDESRLTFRVGDETNLMISLANCCNPQRGDEIVGYISRGRGIIVHKKDCPNLKNMKEIEERSVEVAWETNSPKPTRKYRVTSKRTYDLFSEIEGAIRKYHAHLIGGRLYDDDMDNSRLIGTFTIEIDKEDDFKKVVKALKTLPSINTVSTVT